MGNYLSLGHLLGCHFDDAPLDGSSTAKCFSIHRGYGGGSVGIMNILDVRDIEVGDVTYISDIHRAQIPRTVVIPRNKGIARTQREPSGKAKAAGAYAEPHRETRAADESYKRG